MDSLQATYGDDEAEKVGELSDSAQPPPVGVVIGGNLDTDGDPSDDKTGSNQDNVESEALAPEGGSLSGDVQVTDTDKKPHPVSENCLNLKVEADGTEKVDAEEPPAKRQKQLSEEAKPENPEIGNTELASPSDAIALPSNSGKAPAAKSSKKSKKKKSKDVWMSSSRKGKKKTKHASNGTFKSKDANGGEASSGQKLLIAPIARFPDRNDDSPDLKICLSKMYKAEKVELSEDRLTASSIKGYRMVRATRGVTAGAWYFEIKVVYLGETGHTRLGWSTEKGDLQAPVGYDGNSYGYRDIDGSKVHKALREKYGEEGYKEGDVLGFYVNLPDGDSYAPKPPRLVWHKGQRYVTAPDPKEDPPKVVPGSEASYFKNGVCQGVAFTDLYGGRYYPAASMYTLPNQPPCVVKFNFGPDFECFPEEFGGRPVPRPMIEVPYQCYDSTVDNGNPWNITRMCPMLKAIKDENCKIVKGAEMIDYA